MPSKRPKRGHGDYLKIVCFFCLKKSQKRGRNRNVTSAHKKFIREKLFPQYNEMMEKIMPSGCCDSCNAIVSDLIKNQTSRKLPCQDYQKIHDDLLKIPPLTRSNPTCSCFICQIAKEDCIKPGTEKKIKYEKCENCYALKIPGKHRVCNRTERVKNLMEELTPKTRMKLALETTIEQQSKKESESPIKVSRLSGGPKLAVSVGNQNKLNES